MKNYKYYIINLSIILLTLLLLYKIVWNSMVQQVSVQRFFVLLPVVFLCIFLAYAFKGIRLYIIMLEYRISIITFIKIYLKTTLVNIALPFKLGEVFRIYCYGIELSNYKLSIFLVLIDRYFDTIPLLFLLIVFTIIGKVEVTILLALMICFLLVITFVYLIFPSSYQYLNRYLIMNTHTQRGIQALSSMKKFKSWYSNIQSLIKKRTLLILLISVFTWLLEYGALTLLAISIQEIFTGNDFIEYINAVFYGYHTKYTNLYTSLGAILLMFGFIIVYGIVYRRKK